MGSIFHLARGEVTPVDTELNRAEAELLHEETAMHAELVRLSAIGSDLTKRLKAARFGAAELAAKGVSDVELSARLEVLEVPPVEVEGPFSESRAARQAAVVARRAATQAVRQTVAELKEQLNGLAIQVQFEEKVVKRLSATARRPKEDEATAAVASTPSPAPVTPPAPKLPVRVDHRIERSSPRVKMQAVIDLHSDNNFFNGFSSNISDGGIFVATVNLLPIGTGVDLSFTLPSGQKVAAHGEVRWVREINDQHPDAFPGLGIRFQTLDTAALEAISAFVSSREPLFYVD